MAEKFHRGTDVELDTIVYTDDTFETKKDVSGYTVAGRLGNKDKRLTHLSQAGTIVDGVAGHVRVTLTDVQTELLAPGDIDYICELTDPGGNKAVVTDEVISILQSLK